ncbi:MAG: hypothetical protein AAGJ35_07330, partial [Myxococcota bacterium]
KRKTFHERGRALYRIAWVYEKMKNIPLALSAWQRYLQFAQAYPQEANFVSVASKRVQLLRKLKP